MSNDAKSIPASANAWSVGAKTVNGPSPDSVDARPACVSAATRELCTPVSDAFVGISFVSSADTEIGIAVSSSRAISAVESLLCIAAPTICMSIYHFVSKRTEKSQHVP